MINKLINKFLFIFRIIFLNNNYNFNNYKIFLMSKPAVTPTVTPKTNTTLNATSQTNTTKPATTASTTPVSF